MSDCGFTGQPGNQNDTEADLREWAFDGDAGWPNQDFDLLVVNLEKNTLIIELAADDSCPKQGLFLSCAYLIVGDAVRTQFHAFERREVDHLLNMAKETAHPELLKLVDRSKQLIAEPETFDYDLWCLGGLARE